MRSVLRITFSLSPKVFQQIDLEEASIPGAEPFIRMHGVTQVYRTSTIAYTSNQLTGWLLCPRKRHRFPPISLYSCTSRIHEGRMRGLFRIPQRMSILLMISPHNAIGNFWKQREENSRRYGNAH